ncbi:hypothetical protein LAZ67_17000627 [Cordylochernes scorpioides]|uniref:Mos1 transposase HTH domain-containing protein n=1 Tax=Cordylochernes scorpioides TaxID=51811 RepID=A0ABY6LHN0_9ARAC|nr:hypothetical protein LAZ67_17000627 [Cordylochernes scorpioides]
MFEYDPESKRQSCAWHTKSSPRPKKARMRKSRIKTMIIVFFDIRGIVHCEFVPQGETVNSAFYLEVLRRLKRRIARVRTDIKDTVKLHHDNATSHTAFIITNFLARSNTPDNGNGKNGQTQWDWAYSPSSVGFPDSILGYNNGSERGQETGLFKMEINEIRAVIKYICEKGMLPNEIYEDMVDTLREDSPSYSTVKKWVAAFKLGRISTEDEHRPGRPVESPIQRNLLIDLLPWMRLGPINLHQSPSKNPCNGDTPVPLPPKKAKTVPSAGKVMVSVFWDSDGVLLRDLLNKSQTITGNYYAHLVKKIREAIREKIKGKLSRNIVYYQDNVPSHRSLQVMAAIYDSGFEILPHAPYSPDLAPSDFHLFPHLKKLLSDIHFSSDEKVIDAVTSFLSHLKHRSFWRALKH